MSNIEELRNSIDGEEIKRILAEFQVYPYYENNVYIIFPTCCHNLTEGSPKLYYYFNTHLFVCYTECQSSFDIFELLIKMYRLRGEEISLIEAIKRAGIDDFGDTEISEEKKADQRALEYMKRIQEITVPHAAVLPEINRSILNKYTFNEELLRPWIDEGMTVEALKRFEIMYDEENVAIVIPHKNKDGKIVGIRGRFMEEDAKNKYMPLMYRGDFMVHNLRDNLYGIFENKEPIQRSKTVFIFEAEKSVILYDSYFGKEQNYSLATCGNKISQEQIGLLRELGVREVILCYDKDYHTFDEMNNVQERYIKIGERLANYFKTSIVMDYSNLLDYKDSPIDQGPDVFKELYKYRYYI